MILQSFRNQTTTTNIITINIIIIIEKHHSFIKYLFVRFKPESFGVVHKKRRPRLHFGYIRTTDVDEFIMSEYVGNAAAQRQVMNVSWEFLG